MKLINKKTGEILEDVKYIDTSLTTIEIYYLDNGVLRIKTEKDYHSFLQNWRDYEQPKYPLINDKKICKAVRAWAEANEREYLLVIKSGGRIEISDGSPHLIYISFHVDNDTLKSIDDRTYYPIDELCGEEEQ